MGAFDQISSKVAYQQTLFGIATVAYGTPETFKVTIPPAAVICQAEDEELTSYFIIDIKALPGVNPVLKVEVQNLTSGTGKVCQQEYTTVGQKSNLEIASKAGEELEYTLTFTNDGASGSADFESNVTNVLTNCNA